MKAPQLSKWLRKTPQPQIVMADQKRIDIGTKGGKWGEVVRTIETLGATKIECQDGAGNVIRAINLDDDSDPEAAGKVDGTSDLQVFAKLVAEAYEKGTQAPAKLMESAMSFIERQGQRLVAQDREIERLRALNSKLTAEIMQLKAIPPEAEDEGIMGALMQGVVQRQLADVASEAAPAANGKAARK